LRNLAVPETKFFANFVEIPLVKGARPPDGVSGGCPKGGGFSENQNPSARRLATPFYKGRIKEFR